MDKVAQVMTSKQIQPLQSNIKTSVMFVTIQDKRKTPINNRSSQTAWTWSPYNKLTHQSFSVGQRLHISHAYYSTSVYFQYINVTMFQSCRKTKTKAVRASHFWPLLGKVTGSTAQIHSPGSILILLIKCFVVDVNRFPQFPQITAGSGSTSELSLCS